MSSVLACHNHDELLSQKSTTPQLVFHFCLPHTHSLTLPLPGYQLPVTLYPGPLAYHLLLANGCTQSPLTNPNLTINEYTAHIQFFSSPVLCATSSLHYLITDLNHRPHPAPVSPSDGLG